MTDQFQGVLGVKITCPRLASFLVIHVPLPRCHARFLIRLPFDEPPFFHLFEQPRRGETCRPCYFILSCLLPYSGYNPLYIRC